MRTPDPNAARPGPQRDPGPKPPCLNPAPARRVIRFAPLASGGGHAPAFAAVSADSGGVGGDGGALTATSPVDIPGRGACHGARDGRSDAQPTAHKCRPEFSVTHACSYWLQDSLRLHFQWMDHGIRRQQEYVKYASNGSH